MSLKIFYLNSQKHLQPVRKESIPILLKKDGSGIVTLAFKNESNDVLNDLTIQTTGAPTGMKSGVTTTATPSTADGTTHSYITKPQILKTLYPNQFFYVHLEKPAGKKLSIDYTKFSLDVNYIRSLFPYSNLEVFFEFTESAGDTTLYSSYGNVTGTASKQEILKGDGAASFKGSGDKITFALNNDLVAASIFFKGLISLSDQKVVILKNQTIEMGINAKRQPYISIDSNQDHTFEPAETVTAAEALTDYNSIYTIGVSLTGSGDVLFSINGKMVSVESQPSSPIALHLLKSDTLTLGEFSGEAHSLAIFSVRHVTQGHIKIASNL